MDVLSGTHTRLALAVVLILAFGGFRLYLLRSAKTLPGISTEATPIATERFDPDAAIVLDVGVDGQPGRAGVDDNFNGLVDDALELGAVGGDDRILTPLDPAYSVALAADSTRVMGRGAFVPRAESDDIDDANSREVRTAEIAGRTRVWFDLAR